MIFTCACCFGIFEKEWTDDEAVAEFGGMFPGEKLSEATIVCNDCFVKIMERRSA